MSVCALTAVPSSPSWAWVSIGSRSGCKIRGVLQCSPYHINSTLYPFVQQLDRSAGFEPGDTSEQKLDKIGMRRV
jgi:hypothetical protein